MKQSTPICTPEQIKNLKTQQFSDIQPGTLVKDFNTLLNFIGENGVVVSEKTQFLAMGLLAELNQRLSHPLDVKLKRPVQKSYPHINGLYLLLRASGFAYLDGDGKKAKLMLDKNRLAHWQQLNPTEQYFYLLQVFYYRADTEIIGEQKTRFDRTAFFECLDFFRRDLKDKGFFEIKSPNDKDHLRYMPGLHNLALMELFGFVIIECDKNNEAETWPVAKITLTDFGGALINYFFQNNWIVDGIFTFLIPNQEADDYWEDELKQLIPNWKNSLQENNKTIAASSEGCYIFKVKLGKASCTLGVPANLSLDELAIGILDAFDFDNDHLYEFIYKNQHGIEKHISHPYLDEYREAELTTNQCSVGSLSLYKGMTITFLFDFGDYWEFKIQVAQMPSPELQFDDLTVIEKKGTPPKQYGWDEDDE